MDPIQQHSRLIPASAWAEHHPWPPIGGLRHLIFFADTNGFDKVIRRVGRRVLIDEAAFFACQPRGRQVTKPPKRHFGTVEIRPP